MRTLSMRTNKSPPYGVILPVKSPKMCAIIYQTTIMKSLPIQFFIICFFSFRSSAQSISPATSTEFCPMVSTEFTVTLPLVANGTTPSVASWTNSPNIIVTVNSVTNSQTQTTFKFTGQFRDVNIAQAFKITYTNDGIHFSDFIPLFKNIKSLFFDFPFSQTSCKGIVPNLTSINVPLCQKTNQTLTFSNIKWAVYSENPEYCFGTITEYEYQLPAGWKIGTFTSTGSNWFQGTNIAVITPDEGTGNGSAVLIRPRNTSCGASLANGQTPVQIPITRSGPPMNITGSVTLCYGTNYTFTLNGVPSGATVNWVSNSYYNLTASGNTATVSPFASSNSSTTVKANVTLANCSLVFPVAISVNVGLPYTGFSIISYPNSEPNCYSIDNIYEFRADVVSGYPASGWQWGYRMANTPGDVLYPYNSPYFTLIPSTADDYTIFVKPANACGVGTIESTRTITVVNFCDGPGFRSSVATYPNPATDEIIVTVPQGNKISKFPQSSSTDIALIDIVTGKLVKRWSLPAGQNSYRLTVSSFKKGTYLLRIIKGQYQTSRKLIITK